MKWSKEEEDFLTENYKKYQSVNKAKSLLKTKFGTNRNYCSVTHKVSRMGLTKSIHPNYFSVDEIMGMINDKSDRSTIYKYAESMGFDVVTRQHNATVSLECSDVILQYFNKPDDSLWMTLTEFKQEMGYGKKNDFRYLKKYNIQHLKYKKVIYVPRSLVAIARKYMAETNDSVIKWSYIKENLKRVDCNPLHEVK